MKDILVRKIDSNGISWNDFKYPMKVGEWVEAPDWNDKKECGGGLHGMLNFKGDWELLEGTLWMVITDLEGLVIIDDDKIKIRKGKIDYIGEKDGLYERYEDYTKSFNSEQAYYWARFIGNRDVMIDKILDPEWAFIWATNIGNRNIMMNRMTDSRGAYTWARFIGNRDIMIDRVVESKWAYEWITYIGDRDIMINRLKGKDLKLMLESMQTIKEIMDNVKAARGLI